MLQPSVHFPDALVDKIAKISPKITKQELPATVLLKLVMIMSTSNGSSKRSPLFRIVWGFTVDFKPDFIHVTQTSIRVKHCPYIKASLCRIRNSISSLFLTFNHCSSLFQLSSGQTKRLYNERFARNSY